MSKFKGLLLDFDGVIADSMNGNYAAWQHALGTAGIAISKKDFFHFEGMRTADLAGLLLKQHGKDSALGEQVAKTKDLYYINNSVFEFYPGAQELVREAKRLNLKVALVTGARRERVINPKTKDFFAQFDALVTSDICQAGKPDPEPYQRGAEMLGLKPQECLVVENAPLGIKSAKGAGCYCIAITSTLSPAELAEADLVVSELAQVVSKIT